MLYLGTKKIKMETKIVVDSILETVRAEITEFVEQESSIKCPIEYEKRLIEIGRSVTKNLLLSSQGHLPKSRNSKKKYKLHLAR